MSPLPPPRNTKGMYTSFPQCAQGPEAKQLSPGAQTSSLIHAHVRAPMETGGGKGVLVVQGSSTHRGELLICGEVGKGI